VWAKSGSDGGWLPLVIHAADACAAAGLLFDRWLSDSLRVLVCGDAMVDEGRALVCWLAGLHDVGKASPAFACQVETLAGRMRASGLEIGVARSDVNRPAHSVVGHWVVERYLRGRGWSGVAARSVAVVVGGHHGVPPGLVPAAASQRMV
jgi:CRISPR-associated endonuclease Cas3-HD